MVEMLAPLLTAFGVGGVVGAVATHFLERHAEERKRRMETDKATYSRRSTILITTMVAALIRSNRCLDNEREELCELVQNLATGEHRNDFLDPTVQRAWARFLSKSAECGSKRIAGAITEREIDEYTRAREEWELAAKKAFGPLPEIGTRPLMRNRAGRTEAFRRDAA
jgi:hypothetical protein